MNCPGIKASVERLDAPEGADGRSIRIRKRGVPMKQKFNVTGMTCSACSAHVEKAVRQVGGCGDASASTSWATPCW